MFQWLHAVASLAISRFLTAINRSQPRSETLHGSGIQLTSARVGRKASYQLRQQAGFQNVIDESRPSDNNLPNLYLGCS
jgi:hypothetical protein